MGTRPKVFIKRGMPPQVSFLHCDIGGAPVGPQTTRRRLPGRTSDLCPSNPRVRRAQFGKRPSAFSKVVVSPRGFLPRPRRRKGFSGEVKLVIVFNCGGDPPNIYNKHYMASCNSIALRFYHHETKSSYWLYLSGLIRKSNRLVFGAELGEKVKSWVQMSVLRDPDTTKRIAVHGDTMERTEASVQICWAPLQHE